MSTQPAIRVSDTLARRLAKEVGAIPPEKIERQAPRGIDLSETKHQEWLAFACEVETLFACHDHVIVRGLPVLTEGAMLLVTMAMAMMWEEHNLAVADAGRLGETAAEIGFANIMLQGFLKRRAAELVDGFEPVGPPVLLDCPEYESYFLDCGDKIHYFVEPEAVDKQGNLLRPKYLAMGKFGRGLHLLDPVFRELSSRPWHFLFARALGTHTPALVQSQYIFKQPGIGQKFNLHQDASYMVTEPQSVVGLWLALESAAEYNGCLRVLPGHHRGPLLARFKRQKDVIAHLG